ncbi:MAG: TetR/AcrR family transcriptional regulator [Tannerella sp.]|nr:TetR/AcrR family transcriptional regulator [Tannerella sp.]
MEEKTKEQAILDAAEQEFLEKGFEAAKTTSIASLAGVNHAMLHYYYRTKENLFNKIFEKKLGIVRDSLFVFFDDPQLPFLEKVQRSVEGHFDFLKANPGLPRFVINELIFKPKRLSQVEETIRKIGKISLQRMAAEIDAEVKRGTITPIEPVHLLIDIATLNVFVFVAMPLLNIFAVETFGSEERFLEARKKENVEIIMRRLKVMNNE